MSIRFSDKYDRSVLIEINAHSLFSKWFSESGKLIQRLFKYIQDLCQDKKFLIFVLIDEVESLASARQSALNQCEPSDSIRAVNALLTQIDQLRSYSNVLILTTSNISQSIDLAFIDRADIKQYIGLPSIRARYHILYSCLNELINKQLIYVKHHRNHHHYKRHQNEHFLFEYSKIKALQYDPDQDSDDDKISPIPFPEDIINTKNNNNNDHNNNKQMIINNERYKCSMKLFEIVTDLEKWSARSLRKLPFITHVNYIQSMKTKTCVSLPVYLESLHKMTKHENQQRNKLNSTKTAISTSFHY